MCQIVLGRWCEGRSTASAGHPLQVDVAARSQQKGSWAHASMVPHDHDHGYVEVGGYGRSGSMSLVRDRHLCHTRIMFAVTLVARLHVDLQRVVSAACRTF